MRKSIAKNQDENNLDLNKRQFLKVGLTGVAAAGVISTFADDDKPQTAEKKEKCQEDFLPPKEHSPFKYDCYGEHQAGIQTPLQPFSIIAAFSVSVMTKDELQKMFHILSNRIEFLTQGGELHDPNDKLPPSGSGILGQTILPDGLTITVGLGVSLFD